MKPYPSIKSIVRAASDITGVSVENICSGRKRKSMVIARYGALAAIRELRPELSSAEVAEQCLGAATMHATVLRAERGADNELVAGILERVNR